jgi:hypothetical protein
MHARDRVARGRNDRHRQRRWQRDRNGPDVPARAEHRTDHTRHRIRNHRHVGHRHGIRNDGHVGYRNRNRYRYDRLRSRNRWRDDR